MLLISDKNSHKNISYFRANNDIIQKKNLSNFSTKIGTNNTKSNSNKNIKKIENPLEFIKQKKKFNIHNLFDKNGTKDFLESREKAMMEIKLDDEIIVNDTKKEIKVNPAISTINQKININKETKNSKSRKRRTVELPSNHFKQKKNDSLIQKSNISKMKKKDNPKKHSAIYMSEKISRNNSIDDSKDNNDNNKSNDNILIIERKISDSKDSNYLYKFIIDNANEPDEQFYKKLDKIQKKRNDKKIRSEISKNNSGKKEKELKRFNSDKNWRYTNKNNIFMFSEKAKNLMKNDSLEISSIDIKKESEIKSPKKYQSMKIKSSNIKDKKTSLIFGEEEINFINDNKRDSVLQILDGLKA